MGNTINKKKSLRFTLTKPAKKAGLVSGEDQLEGHHVRVYGFDQYIIVAGINDITDENLSEIIVEAIEYTKTAYSATNNKISKNGNGWGVQLAPAKNAGFEADDELEAKVAPALVFLKREYNHPLDDKLVNLRKSQLNNED